ncbi:CapA family protein [bacterium]|nr:CapA family protein [bacterium]
MKRPLPFWISLVLLPVAAALLWLALDYVAEQELPARGLVGYADFTPSEELRVYSLVLCGDVMLARKVRKVAELRNDPAWAFRRNLFLTATADIAFANLESLFKENPNLRPDHLSFQLKEEQLPALQVAGFDVLSLANNHTSNVGRDGVAFSLDILRQAGIEPCGAGRDLDEAHQPAIIRRDDLTVAFLAYAGASSLTAGANSAGHSAWGMGYLREDVAAVRDEVDLVVVSLHLGSEYAPQPNAIQVSFARGAIDAGADIVAGHHPHVLEPIELYNGGLICYSLGNYVFDQEWNYDAQQTAAIEVLIRGGELQRALIHPLTINLDYQPEPANASAGEILQRLGVDGTRLEL